MRRPCDAPKPRVKRRRARAVDLEGPSLPHSSHDHPSTSLPPFKSDEPIPTFELNLDLPPRQRWAKLAQAYRNRFGILVNRNGDALRALCASSLAPSASSLPPEHQSEVRALARLLRQPVSLLAALQFTYEAFALTDLSCGPCGCTSAAVDCSNGVAHGRTLDWAWLDGLSSLLVELRVVRGVKRLYTCTSIVGHVGVLTGMRTDDDSPADSFSISLNYRRPFDGAWVHGEPVLQIPPPERNPFLAAAEAERAAGALPASFLLRLALETCTTFERAVSFLASERMLAPCYILVAGARSGEAALLTRSLGTGCVLERIQLSGELCVANLDPSEEEIPALPSSKYHKLGSIEAKDFIQGESLLRRDICLKQLRDLRASLQSSCPATVANLGFEALARALATPPVSNESTLHLTIMGTLQPQPYARDAVAAIGMSNARREGVLLTMSGQGLFYAGVEGHLSAAEQGF
ncbi:MAG: hypothetical protein SGPRY_009733 [Prymnesium sp.]